MSQFHYPIPSLHAPSTIQIHPGPLKSIRPIKIRPNPHPNPSKSIQIHPDPSRSIQIAPNPSRFTKPIQSFIRPIHSIQTHRSNPLYPNIVIEGQLQGCKFEKFCTLQQQEVQLRSCNSSSRLFFSFSSTAQARLRLRLGIDLFLGSGERPDPSVPPTHCRPQPSPPVCSQAQTAGDVCIWVAAVATAELDERCPVRVLSTGPSTSCRIVV